MPLPLAWLDQPYGESQVGALHVPKRRPRPLHNKSAVYSVFFLAHLYDRRIYRVFHQLLPLFPQNGFTVYSEAHLTK